MVAALCYPEGLRVVMPAALIFFVRGQPINTPDRSTGRPAAAAAAMGAIATEIASLSEMFIILCLKEKLIKISMVFQLCKGIYIEK